MLDFLHYIRWLFKKGGAGRDGGGDLRMIEELKTLSYMYNLYIDYYIFSLLKNNRLEHLQTVTCTREMSTESEIGLLSAVCPIKL